MPLREGDAESRGLGQRQRERRGCGVTYHICTPLPGDYRLIPSVMQTMRPRGCAELPRQRGRQGAAGDAARLRVCPGGYTATGSARPRRCRCLACSFGGKQPRPICSFSVGSPCPCLGIRGFLRMRMSKAVVLPCDSKRCTSAGATASKDSLS